jgi:predicted nucleic-acid-binding Zn-ribbon protein
MRKMDKCSKCGSSAIVPRAMVADRNHKREYDLKLRVDAQPAAMIFKQAARSAIHACVCSSCGYVEFYADDPKALYDAFLAAPQDAPQIT